MRKTIWKLGYWSLTLLIVFMLAWWMHNGSSPKPLGSCQWYGDCQP